jgi:hypothetical protein
MRIDAEREVPKHLRSQPIAQPHVLESDHPPLSDNLCLTPPNHCPPRGPPKSPTESLQGIRKCTFYKIMGTLP